MSTVSDEKVRLSHDLSEGEKVAIGLRKAKVMKCLESLGMHCDQDNIPNITLLASGGALRAMVSLQGTLVEMKQQGLLDAILYLYGVSGSTWCMSYLYKDREWTEHLQDLEKKLCQTLVESSWDKNKAISTVVEASKEEHYSLTDFWVSFMIYKILHKFDESGLSEQKTSLESGKNPYPIYAAADNKRLNKGHESLPETWFEFTPHEAGYPAVGAFINTSLFGSDFENGELKVKKKEKTICYLEGLWGSALGNIKEIKKLLQESLTEFFKGSGEKEKDHVSPNPESPNVHFTAVEEKERSAISLFFAPVLDAHRVTTKTAACLLSWTWGTTSNFLYKCPNIKSTDMVKDKVTSFIDAGLAINSAYPLALRPERKVKLILSFDFSSGDPFETIKKTVKYCQANKIPFPKVDEEKLKDTDNPSDCYIFTGVNVPTVMHFPLFNNINCSGKIADYRKKYSTFTSSYPKEDIQELLKVAKMNVTNNAQKILEEIKQLVASSTNP
ncbi:cytosolic phospholipase A2 gamma isoform X1 [Alligator mississippiensis]|uniref:Cytosolic phospholipase A2 gamma n=1 Tax=Alligator mississippiensis TaxID=8496 RepID=A0A151MHR9_ALLMI|nr:cytosolic phospholipase A2 gamma isoform X1 [Alligator mississippiensis]KYO24086.1 cytosolic phospholipase A2 gamma [Alligator mississippiensis]